MSTGVTHASVPALFPVITRLLIQAARGKPNSGASPVGLSQRVEQARLKPARLRRYQASCGYPDSPDSVPICFPQLAVFPLQLRLLAAPQFPFTAAGLVHVSHRIEQHQPLSTTGTYEIESRLSRDEITDRGREFAIDTVFRDGETVVWQETMGFLKPARKPGGRRATRESSLLPEGEARTSMIHASSDIGRRYAGISGDYNPIHLFDTTARWFGFSRKIAHGMWMLGRCASAMPASGKATLEVKFKLPLYLPGKAELLQVESGAVTSFCLRNPENGKPHLLGSLAHE